MRSSISSIFLGTAALISLASAADLNVPACPATVRASFNQAIPDLAPCPLTTVDLCYTSTALNLVFTASGETSFYFNPSHTTNGDIWAYEVMEAFIYKGTDNPQTYFEYEVSPNNVTYNAFIYNPSRVRAAGTPFDHAFVTDPFGDGFKVTTALDKPNQKWVSSSSIPLALFNAENPQGTNWRMNFFRTITDATTYPQQKLCGWKNTNAENFHITPSFGTLAFV